MITEFFVSALVLVGCLFCILAAIGVVRMPDLLVRMQSATKAGTLGVACTAAAAAIHFNSPATSAEAVILILLLFLTAPIASHLIGRAAYVSGIEIWSQTTRDDMKQQRSPGTRPAGERDAQA